MATLTGNLNRDLRAIANLHGDLPSRERLVLDEGFTCVRTMFTARELEMVAHLFKETAGRFPMKECYSNAERLATRAYGIWGDKSPFHYAEGYGVTPGLPLPFEHAIVVMGKKPIDVTWRDDKETGTLVERLLARVEANQWKNRYRVIPFSNDVLRGDGDYWTPLQTLARVRITAAREASVAFSLLDVARLYHLRDKLIELEGGWNGEAPRPV